MPPHLRLPFADGEAWPITNRFDDPRTRALYRKFGLAGHEGIDWGCPEGTPILAMAGGRVTRVHTGAADSPTRRPYGNEVRVHTERASETAPAFELTYAHLAAVAVATGQVVLPGERVGLSGHTGHSTGPHLHAHCKPQGVSPRNGFGGAVDFHAWLPAALPDGTAGAPRSRGSERRPPAEPTPGTAGPCLRLQAATTAGLNVRAGPGLEHAVIGLIPGGSADWIPILGKDAPAPVWWRIRFRGAQGWVHGAYVQTRGDTRRVPVR